MKKYKHILSISLIALTLFSCRDPFDAETDTFISALVVEATITNELKQQKVTLSNTYVLEENAPTAVNNATVWVEDNANNTYTFSQDEDGDYLSDIVFQAVSNNLYTLYITTADGKNYESTPNTLTPVSQIDNLYAELIPEENEIQILVDSNNENDATYFRYEYEETYKVVVPNHSFNDINVDEFGVDGDGNVLFDLIITPREQEEKTCFTTNNSFGITQASTNELVANNVYHFSVKAIDFDNPVLRDRYSIKVRQYVQNVEAFTYYKIINELGGLQSILSLSQPGYVTGNISNLEDENEKIIGYFEVASVSEKRIYFNYQDFGLNLPPWFYLCDVATLDYGKTGDNPDDPQELNERLILLNAIKFLDYKYISHAGNNYTIVNPECGDCTSFSSNVRPDFWED